MIYSKFIYVSSHSGLAIGGAACVCDGDEHYLFPELSGLLQGSKMSGHSWALHACVATDPGWRSFYQVFL